MPRKPARSRHRARSRAHVDVSGLGRPIPRTCSDADKVQVPGYRRCKPPKRALTTVRTPGRGTPPQEAERAVQAAEEVVKQAAADVRSLEKELHDAERIAKQAERQVKKIREVRYRQLTDADFPSRRSAREEVEAEEAAPPSRASAQETREESAARAAAARDARRLAAEEKRRAEEAFWKREPETRKRNYTPDALKTIIGRKEITENNVGRTVREDPCTGDTFAEFMPEAPDEERRAGWFRQVKRCAGVDGLRGLAGRKKLSRTREVALKNKLIGRRPGTRAPTISSIDPWAFDVDPCDGMSYRAFRGGFTRQDAYWAAVRQSPDGERHSPSKKKVDAAAAKLKREAWREKLHACGLRVWANRARVSKDPAVRRAGERAYAEHVQDTPDASAFMDGLGRTRPKGVKRCANAPKKLQKRCAEVTYRDNIRHLICVGKKHPKQANAIAANTLVTACHTTRRTKKGKTRTIKQVVTQGRRNATLRKKRKAKR